jgi:hypothetical protein
MTTTASHLTYSPVTYSPYVFITTFTTQHDDAICSAFRRVLSSAMPFLLSKRRDEFPSVTKCPTFSQQEKKFLSEAQKESRVWGEGISIQEGGMLKEE